MFQVPVGSHFKPWYQSTPHEYLHPSHIGAPVTQHVHLTSNLAMAHVHSPRCSWPSSWWHSLRGPTTVAKAAVPSFGHLAADDISWDPPRIPREWVGGYHYLLETSIYKTYKFDSSTPPLPARIPVENKGFDWDSGGDEPASLDGGRWWWIQDIILKVST